MQPKKTNESKPAESSIRALVRGDARSDTAREVAAEPDELKLGTTLAVPATPAFTAFDAEAEVEKHEGRLPHWRQWGRTYFVTSRLADSVPVAVANEWRKQREAWLRGHGLRSAEELGRLPERQRHEYHREFTAKFHELLDAGYGECLLALGKCAEMVVARLTAGHGTAYELDGWCIMPNHLHGLVRPGEKVTLGEIVRHWKGGSAHDINRMLGREGPLWQKEPFDHIVRSPEQLEHFRRYIAANPTKAHLKEGYVVGNGGDVVCKVVKSFSS